MPTSRPNLWKFSTLLLASALAFSWGGALLPAAEAAGPKRLTAALAALHASKKHLDDAKDPPAPFHNQSVAAVTKAIDAVEREIKALEDKPKGKDREKDRDHEKGEKADKSAKTTEKSKGAKKATSHDDEAGE